MTLAEIKKNIDKLQKNVDNPNIPEKFRKTVREQIAALEKQMKQMSLAAKSAEAQQEKAETAKKKAQADREKLAAEKRKADAEKKKLEQLQKQAEAEKKAAEAAKKKADEVARKKKGKISEVNRAECQVLVNKLQGYLDQYNGKKPKTSSKPRKKKSSSVVAMNIIKPIEQIARREMTQDKVVKIKTDRLEKAKKHFADGLQEIKLAFGGIQDSNSTILKNFKKEMDRLIKEIENKQKDVKKSA